MVDERALTPTSSREEWERNRARRLPRRTFETCLMAQDEVELSERLVGKFPALRFMKGEDINQRWQGSGPPPPVPIYRSIQDVPGTMVYFKAYLLPPDWRPNWSWFEAVPDERSGWIVDNQPVLKICMMRSYIAQARPKRQEPRFNAPPIVADYLQSQRFRIFWDPDDPESKRAAMAMIRIVDAVTTQNVQVTEWSRPLKWVEIRDRVRYGKHALEWCVAAPHRMLGFYGRTVALPRGVDPKSLGFDDALWDYFRPSGWR